MRNHVSNIEEDKKDEYKKIFDQNANNKKGTLSMNKILKILSNFNYEIEKKELLNLIKEIGSNNENELDFEGFCLLMEKTVDNQLAENEEEAMELFKLVDKDNDGKISNFEFRYLLTNFGDKFTKEECDALFRECDLDNDGFLEYEDFMEFWKNQ